MKYYAVAELDVTDRSWVAAYVQFVTPLVESYGGRYLARTATIEKLEGERQPSQILLIIEWPSREIARAFYDSPEYEPYRATRLAGARNELVLVAGEDVTQTARIPE